jgi:2-dehydro-3-deoxygluconokinase
MVMFAPPRHQLIEQSTRFTSYLGGAESNVAIGLERLGMHSGWIGKLTNNALGRKLANEMRAQGVDTSGIVWTDKGRVGTFFFEFAAPPRPQVTVYDRAGSAATTLVTDELPWNYINRAEWVHLTGITPALSETCRRTAGEIAERVKRAGLKLCLDVNYRELMWNRKDARIAIRELLPHVDLLVATKADAQMLAGGEHDDREMLRMLMKEHHHSAVVITCGEKGCIAYNGDSYLSAPGYEAVVVNRLGAGDAFTAGLLYGIIRGGLSDGVRYGCAMAALKLAIPENTPLVDKADVDRLVAGQSVELVR